VPALFPDDERARRLKEQSFLLGEFVAEHGIETERPPPRARKALIQVHCHEHALAKPEAEKKALPILRRSQMPGTRATYSTAAALSGRICRPPYRGPKFRANYAEARVVHNDALGEQVLDIADNDITDWARSAFPNAPAIRDRQCMQPRGKAMC
jgi:hypothetical protein